MTIPVSDAAVLTFLREWYGDPTLILSDFDTDGVHMPTRARAAIEAALPELGVAPDGVWLWCRLMDWCKQQRIAPATQDALFSIVGECHKANKQSHPAPGREGQDNG